MTRSADIPWKRLSVEVVVIVSSILLAFWIDAWWDDRSDAVQQRALLEALAEDFRTARDEFESTRNGHKLVFQSMEQILHWAEAGSVPEEERQDVDGRLSHFFWRQTFDPAMGAVDTILASGRLDLLTNSSLVSELTRWKSLVSDLKGRENDAVEHFYEVIYPFLSARLRIQDLDKDIPYPGGLPWPQQPTEAHLLMADREFHNIVYVHWVLHWNIDQRLPRVDAALDRILTLAQDELKR